jgi:hypothetical protein
MSRVQTISTAKQKEKQEQIKKHGMPARIREEPVAFVQYLAPLLT